MPQRLAVFRQIDARLGLAMAAANIVWSLLGSALALKHGATLVRRVFVAVVTLLLVKTAWQAYF